MSKVILFVMIFLLMVGCNKDSQLNVAISEGFT
jgi:hypothetical protein